MEWTATALSQAIHALQVSCVEVLEAYLAQIDRLNPIVNALVAPVVREGLRAQAQERDAQLARGISLGPLHGFPQAPKDIMPVAGMVTTRGSPIFAGQVIQADAAVFERTRASGALFVARTNSPEFGLGGHTCGLALSAMAVYDAAKVRSAWYQTLRQLFETFDFLVLPATQVFPFDAELDWPHQIAGRDMDTYYRWAWCQTWGWCCW